MEIPAFELIRIGPLTVRYFNPVATAGVLDCFEFSVPAQTKGSPQHYHRDVDEMVYGVAGHVTFTVAGEDRVLGPGAFTFIPRGTAHSFANTHDEPGTALGVMTPGLIGVSYFREMAALFSAGPPDPTAIGAVMTKHGLIPVEVQRRNA